jgi:two-component system response regulator BaeR
MTERILIVEDEPILAKLMTDCLHQAGYQVFTLENGLEVVDWVKEQSPDLILLDLNLPGKHGMEICKEVRSFSAVPIVMVTSCAEEIDRLLGLELGADDYVCKPFSPRELAARVKAILRRTTGQLSPSTQDLTLNVSSYRAELRGKVLDLTALEFQLLNVLASSPGRIYSRDQLMDKIYPDHRIVDDRTIDTHVKKLRQKIAAVAPDWELIHSVYGVGYKFENTE